MDGKGESDEVSSDEFRNLIRKLRLDNDIKAIVFRVNSPGGSSLASDVIWREITLARKEKPVVVSMGDVAASGGYYISCNADSVFANANTITGSIGVFSIVPNFESFFRNKLGVTFDRVKTAPFADMGSGDRPLNETEKRFVQSAVDSIYHTFKTRVSEGRKKDMVYIDSIAQGRVWTGTRASQIGLVDRVGTMQDAVGCAARMAKLKDYRTREYPEKKGFLEQLMSNYKKSVSKDLIKEELDGIQGIGRQQQKTGSVRIQIDEVTQEGHVNVSQLYDLPATPGQLKALCIGIHDEGKTWAEKEWSPMEAGKPFSIAGIRELKKEMLRRGLLVAANSKSINQGMVETAVGRRVVEKWRDFDDDSGTVD